jgi:uncharacterized membrane protein YhaH (DUF805 family)
MNLLQTYRQTWKKSFDYKTRSSRKEYWTFFFITLGVVITFSFVMINIDSFVISSILAMLLTIVFLCMVAANIALSVRRLHDIDFSGWWYFITFIPLVGLLFLIVTALLPGTPSDNRFGAEPKEAYLTTPSTPDDLNSMSIKRIYIRAWKKTFDYKSRSIRKEYWAFFLINSIIFTLTLLIVMYINSMTISSDLEVFLIIFFFCSTIASIAMGVRRLHDIDFNGWWILIHLIPGIGSLSLIVLAILDGTPGNNRFGPDPKNRTQEQS